MPGPLAPLTISHVCNRQAAGESWYDPSLDEWPQGVFGSLSVVTCIGRAHVRVDTCSQMTIESSSEILAMR